MRLLIYPTHKPTIIIIILDLTQCVMLVYCQKVVLHSLLCHIWKFLVEYQCSTMVQYKN